jgi:hypothetical protein
LAVTHFDRENARSVPENTGRIGRYKTIACCLTVGYVEAARFSGGQPVAPFRSNLIRYLIFKSNAVESKPV